MYKDESLVQRVEIARGGSVRARDGTLFVATAEGKGERGEIELTL